MPAGTSSETTRRYQFNQHTLRVAAGTMATVKLIMKKIEHYMDVFFFLFFFLFSAFDVLLLHVHGGEMAC